MNRFERWLFSTLDKYFDAREVAKEWDTRHCPRCAFPVRVVDNYCSHCGTELREWYVTTDTVEVPAMPRKTGALLLDWIERNKR